MPHQVKDVTISDNGDGTVNIQIGAIGHTRQISWLFDRSGEDYDLIKQNIGVAFRLGNYVVPNTLEFLNLINKGTIGLEGVKGRVVITSIDDEGDDNYRIWVGFGQPTGQIVPAFGIPVTLEYLKNSDPGDEAIINNLRPHLRIGGHNQLNQAAISSVKSARFWR